ncbi:hypothetical protein SSX86_016899 [Deinandra increscens subsp. villosa]|uniref:non-specific serine/threonine protein kinase n=1 Tax=Deinandra increscens subsp. villosa TaxID=3103831 RepID=A0AAP0GWA1_9ASTR
MTSSSTKDTSNMNFFDYVASITIPLTEIKSATNNFAPENIIARGSYANVYKGKLSQSGEMVDIVVRRCLQPNGSIVVNDLTMYKNLKHKNIISLFKVDDTHDQAFTIHKYEANESLDKHLTRSTLTWMQRLQICADVACALCYLHSGLKDDHSVIHGNIKSSKILLDYNWEPKLHDFRCAVKVKRHQLYLSNNYTGTLQYMDPAFESTGGLTHKSDVFSFGVVLFEVLFGMKASIEEEDNWYFAKMARSCYEEKTLDDKIDRDLREQMDIQSLNLFSEIAYLCLKEQRAKRPDMEHIVKKLERALELHQRHVHPTSTAAVEDASSNRLKGNDMDHLKVQLSEIKLATEKFSQRYLIGLGGYGMVYLAELKFLDGIRTVAIKRILKRGDGQGEQGFIAEIEMLSRCKHRNIVSLLGFCDEDDEMILICEYVSKGSLDNYLGNVDNMTNFTWAQRIKICLDIANGLQYLHTSIHDKNTIIHRDIKSANILLDDKWVAKIADFGLSKLHHANELVSTLVTNNIAGTPLYLDPVYENEGKLKKKSDIYSFGVVLFEILCGRLAHDQAFNGKGLAAVARECYKDGTLKKLIDPKIKEADENIFILNGGLNQVSLNKFLEIAYKCVSESQNERPTMKHVIKELEEALYYQENNKDNLHISLEEVKLGTENFSDCKCIGVGRCWKQYEGEITHANKRITVVAKRWDNKFYPSRHQFFTELQILYEYKHKNIISLVGYCNEMGEKIIVYENASNGSLDKHLNSASLTWMDRLKICIDVARGLDFLHTNVLLMHRDIKCASILLDDNWNAKIFNLELCAQLSDVKPIEHVTDDNAYGSLSYVSKDDMKQNYLTRESDIYSLGVVLKQVLWGRLTDPSHRATHNVVYNGQEILYYLVFDDLKEQIDPESSATFVDIAGLCLAYKKYRPRAQEVVAKLEKALKFQISNTPQIYDSTEMKKDLSDMFSKGTLLKDDKVWLSLGSKGERSEMISARNFSYKNRRLHKWRSVQGSRFPKVAEMIDISNLKIQIKTKTQFISPSINHKVHLIFRVCGPRQSKAKRMYVKLKYKTGNEETLHAYFATRRDDGWMMIELFQSLNHKEDDDFEVLLESFSRCYCGSSSIYIEGIEFQAIEKVIKDEEIERLNEVQQSSEENSNTDKEEKQAMMLSAKEVVHTSSELWIPHRFDGRRYRTIQVYHDSSRFSGAIEFQRYQVFRIKCKLEHKMLSAITKNACYLVFKLSEKCCGLHGPVLVRNLFHRKQKDTGVLYFRSPNRRDLVYDNDWIPEKRKDGWMEVILWVFNSANELENDHLLVDLKLITYEGSMSGLIMNGIEFRPI